MQISSKSTELEDNLLDFKKKI